MEDRVLVENRDYEQLFEMIENFRSSGTLSYVIYFFIDGDAAYYFTCVKSSEFKLAQNHIKPSIHISRVVPKFAVKEERLPRITVH